jgi:hypothetical protein
VSNSTIRPEERLHADARLGRVATLVVVGVIACLFLTAATAVGAAVFKYNSGAAITAVRTATTTGTIYATSATTFDAIRGSQVIINVPSGEKAILIITFSAESRCVGGGACLVTAYVDGAQIHPAEIDFDHSEPIDASYESRSFQWVSNVLGAGQHTVGMAGRVTKGMLLLDARSLTVLRASTS